MSTPIPVPAGTPQSGPIPDGNSFGDDVVRHHVCGLLIAIHYVRKREKNVMARSGRDAEFSVRVAADLKTQIMDLPAQTRELG